jgi:phosphatidylethanolamine-binding protein (PEBP) family uncharacterized protein
MWKTSLPLASAVIGLALLGAPGEANAFGASFSWSGIPACSSVSPAFRLSGVPKGTKRLRFRMTDLNKPSYPHGGATVNYSGSSVRRGAIGYTGPCPPGGERHRYRWTVQALDASGKVLGTASATRTFPP